MMLGNITLSNRIVAAPLTRNGAGAGFVPRALADLHYTSTRGPAAIDKRKMRVYTRIMTRCYCALLRAATRRIGSTYDEALTPLGINIAQYSLLRTIQRLQPVSFTELGRRAELDRSTVGRNVRVLERMNLVETGRAEGDQREAVIKLADKGSVTLDEAGPLWEKCQRKIETRLGPVKVIALQNILRAI